jgi:apolipoprotein N-acyltransferase
LPKTNLFFLSWVAFLPLFFALRDRSLKEAFLLGGFCGLAHFLSALYWIHYVVSYYGGLQFSVAAMILVLLCGYLAIYPAIFAFLARLWAARPALWVFGLPCAWVMLEWFRGHALSGFPWANLGYTQTPWSSIIQIADITGVYGVSWLVVLGNTTLMVCLQRRRIWVFAPVFAAIMIAAMGYGLWRTDSIEAMQKAATPWTVGVIQGNIDQSKKWDPAFQQETLSRYRRLSLEAARSVPEPNLLVWPETSAPFFYGLDADLTDQLGSIFREIGKPVLFGSPAAMLIDGKPRLLNRAYLVDGGGTLYGSYAKQHLVPFGEYVPFKRILFFVDKLVEAAGDFAAGTDSSPLTIDGQPFGILICYEGIFPELARAAAERGAMSFLNITNDAWYGDTSAPYQHMIISVWRAIEYRVPLIRAANTGVSVIADSLGRVEGKIELNREGYFVSTVHPLSSTTIYERVGNLFAVLCTLTTLGGILFSIKVNRSV